MVSAIYGSRQSSFNQNLAAWMGKQVTGYDVPPEQIPEFDAAAVNVGGLIVMIASNILPIKCANSPSGSNQQHDAGTIRPDGGTTINPINQCPRPDGGADIDIPEICNNGIDDNRDGVIDAQECYVPQPCDISQRNTTRPYYTDKKRPDSWQYGICERGEERCLGEPDSERAYYIRCSTEVTPFDEVCDTYDNDCDGLTNEGNVCGNLDAGVSDAGASDAGFLDAAVPDARIPDATIFIPDMRVTDEGIPDIGLPDEVSVCVPTEELCNGIDDDCDELIDEELIHSCYTGPDETRGVAVCTDGSQACIDGVWEEECVGQVLPSDELLDCIDNDCDGIINNEISLATADVAWLGEAAGHRLGFAAGTPFKRGDINADGYNDILLFHMYGVGGGRVYITYGSEYLSGARSVATSNVIIDSVREREIGFGTGLGDINSDGYADILLGAYNNNEYEHQAGKVTIFYGREDLPPALTTDNNDLVYFGDGEYRAIGYLNATGDINGDRFNDLVIAGAAGSAPWSTEQIYTIFGPVTQRGSHILSEAMSSVVMTPNRTLDELSNGVNLSLGNINGDTYDDLAIGVGVVGRTYIVKGSDRFPHDYPFSTSPIYFSGGIWDGISFIGDVDGDGLDDLGSHNYSNTVFGFFGSADTSGGIDESLADFTINTDTNTYLFSFPAGDFNGDGYKDFIVSSTIRAGLIIYRALYLFQGREDMSVSLSLNEARASFVPEGEDDLITTPVSAVGDINRDGHDDLMVYAPQNDEAGENAGKAYLFYGRECPAE